MGFWVSCRRRGVDGRGWRLCGRQSSMADIMADDSSRVIVIYRQSLFKFKRYSHVIDIVYIVFNQNLGIEMPSS